MAESLKTIAVDLIDPANDNLRETMDDQSINDLARSIEFIGLIEPIRVTKVGDRYTILAGHRRFEAIVQLGWTEVKALVQSGKASDENRTATMLIENMQRVDLQVNEQAEGVRRLMQEHGFTQKQVAESLGVSAEWVKDRVAILDVDDVFIEREEQKLPVKHLALLGQLTEDRRERLTKKETEQPGSVGQYQIEEAVNKQRSEEAAEKRLRKLRKDGYLATTEKELKRIMAAELADLDGLDQAIKLKIGAATKILANYWEKSEEPALRTKQLHSTDFEKGISKNDVVFVKKVSGYAQWHKAEVEVPGTEDAEPEVSEKEAEIDRIVEANDQAREDWLEACAAAERDWVSDAKPAELVSKILRHELTSLERGFRSFANTTAVLQRCGLDTEDVPEDADVEAQRAIHDKEYNRLVEWATKNASNLARAVAHKTIIESFGNVFGIELPAEPEYQEIPEDEDAYF